MAHSWMSVNWEGKIAKIGGSQRKRKEKPRMRENVIRSLFRDVLTTVSHFVPGIKHLIDFKIHFKGGEVLCD